MSFDNQPCAVEAAAFESDLLSAAASSPPLPPKPPRLSSLAGAFGGGKRRSGLQQQVRCFCPVTQKPVTFRHERHQRVWLKQRFNPDARELNAAPPALAYRRLGVRFSAIPDLQWKRPDGRGVYLWLRKEWSLEQRLAHEHFALTHDADVVLVSWEDVDSDDVLLDNLEWARQVMTSLAHAGVDLRCLASKIRAHLERSSECTRGELGAALTCRGCLPSADHLDAALFHLHTLRVIRIEFEEQTYGDSTPIYRI